MQAYNPHQKQEAIPIADVSQGDDFYEDPTQVSEKEAPSTEDLYEESPVENIERKNSKGIFLCKSNLFKHN